MGKDDSPEQLHGRFQEAFNRHDLESIVALYESDAVLVSVDGHVRGMDAIRELYSHALATRPFIEVQTLGVTRVGNIAMLHGKWVLSQQSAGGVSVRRMGRNTEIARQQSDGRWLFVIDNPSVPQD